MLTGQRDKVKVGNLVCAGHQIGADYAVVATQIVGHKFVAWIGKQLSEDAEGYFWSHPITKQRVG